MSGSDAAKQTAEELAPGQVEDLWSEQDTTPDHIEAAMRRMVRERHAANDRLAPARVLNLVVVVDRDWKGEIANRLSRVGRYHASRTVLCAVEDGRTTLDAWAAMSYSEPNSGLGVMHDSIEIDLGPEHLQRLDTIIDPVIISELPTMLWSPHGHEDAVDTLRRMVDVALRDTDDGGDPAEGLARANELLADSYVVDLAYLRTTPWRERLASAFDPPRRRQALHRVSAVTIRHHSGSTASALLLAGWLASRLGWEPSRLEPAGRDRLAGTARAGSRSVRVVLAPTDQDVPGLSGVTVTSERDLSLSLDRAQGGLKAREVRGEKEREWRILGASRGEGGILGEGVRQAHLRDPTYGPALSAAREFCPG